MKHAGLAFLLALVLGFVAWLSPGHPGHDLGGGVACVFIVFVLAWVGPKGMEVGDD